MKRLKSPLLFTLLFVTVLSACSKDDDDMHQTADKTIAELVSTDSDLSLLKAAVVRADLVTTLSGNGPFTVFAPDNDAFKNAGLDTEEKINAIPVEQLKSILLYHVIAQKYDASSIPTGTTELATANQAKAYVTKKSNDVFVNGSGVKQADIQAKNGVIHVINRVLMPPAGNIVATAQGNPNLSFLVAAVVRASSGTTNVAQVLSGAGPFTVFAPTNAAFQSAGFANIAAIQSADPNTLAAILTYHVLPSRVFSSDLSEGLMAQTANGGNVTITLNGGAKVKGSKNATAASIAITDIVTTNGVVHVIDQVLLP